MRRDAQASLAVARSKRSIAFAGLAAIAIAWAASPAAAQSNPFTVSRSFAAVDSPGRPQQVCIGSTLAAVRDCAIAKCRGVGGRGCRVTAACDRAQWSGSLGVELQGSRFVVTICGVPSRPSVIAILKDMCRSYRSRGLEACSLDTVWTPAGDAETADLRWTRQSLRFGSSATR